MVELCRLFVYVDNDPALDVFIVLKPFTRVLFDQKLAGLLVERILYARYGVLRVLLIVGFPQLLSCGGQIETAQFDVIVPIAL